MSAIPADQPPHVTPHAATMSGAVQHQYQPTDDTSFNFYSQQYSNEMLRLPSNPDLQKLHLLYGGQHPAQLTKQLSLDINSFLNLNGQQSHYPYTSASNTPTHQDSTGTDTLASLPLHHQATSGVNGGGSLSRNNSLLWQMPAAIYPSTKRQLTPDSATNSPSSAQTKRQRISTDDLALPVSQYQPHSGASSTVVMPSSDDDQLTDSPHSTSSVPPLSPMLNSPPYSTHTHAASPFRHSAADVMTSEFTLPPPMQTSSSGGDNHSPRVGKLSRYITVDEPQQSSQQQQASNGSANGGQSYAILNALSPDSRTKALPSTANQLRAVLGGSNAVRVEHNQQAVRNNGVVKHRAAAQAYPAAFQSPTLQAVIPKDTRGLHNSPVAQAVRSPPMLSAAVPKSTLSALQQPRPHLQPHPSHYTPTPQPLPEHYPSIHRRADHLQPPHASSPRSSTPLSEAGSVTSHSTTSSAHSHKLKTQNANTMVLNADGQLVKRRHRDNLSSPTIATPQSSSITPPLSSTRTSSRQRRPSVAQTSHKGHLETTMSHKNYRDTDGKDHDIRILTVTNTAIDGVETFVHAADLGGVVERKSNISRLFGQFHSPAEKVLMNVTGSHNHSIGQESNVLTRAGVLKFFTVSKMRGQDAYKRWIEQSLLPIFARDSSVMENVDPSALQAPPSLPLAPQRAPAARKTPTKSTPKRKATKSRYVESDDDSESDIESVLEEDDDEQEVIQADTDEDESDNDEDFKPSSR